MNLRDGVKHYPKCPWALNFALGLYFPYLWKLELLGQLAKDVKSLKLRNLLRVTNSEKHHVNVYVYEFLAMTVLDTCTGWALLGVYVGPCLD